MLKFVPVAVALVVFCRPAFAQSTPEEAASKARIQVGRLRLNPTIALTDVGVDDNVFNEADANRPKSDFTMTVTPATDAWLRLGRSWITASMKEDLVYYGRFASERSMNGTYKADALVRLNRLSFTVGGDYRNARDRPGFEIDARSQHTEAGYRGAMELRAFSKTFVSVTAERSTVAFARDALFLGASLQQELDRTMTVVGVTARHQLTPVTGLRIELQRQEDRFEFSPGRDSSSTRIDGGVTFGARIGGVAMFGFSRFEPHAADLPGYTGPNASVNMTFALVGSTRLAVRALRDLRYSYDFQQPYYVNTGGDMSVTQGLRGPLDGTMRVGVQQLAFRGRIGTIAQPDRTDLIHSIGGGLGYRVSPDMRVGFNVDRQRRTSDLPGHGYGGMRYGTSVTYGF